LASENLQATLDIANQKLKDRELAVREFETTLEGLSRRSNDERSLTAKLEREKSVAESRIRELEASLRQATASAQTSSIPVRTQGRAARPRSSSVYPGIHQELNDSRALLAKKEAELRSVNEKLSRVQTQLNKAENEKAATEKRMSTELRQIQASLEEKQDEIDDLKAQQAGDGGGVAEREDALLKRIDEDCCAIATLEEALKKSQRKLQIEAAKLAEAETRQVELVREKEEALDELEGAEIRIEELSRLVNDYESHTVALTTNARYVMLLVPICIADHATGN
jgi:DNA repair exonuclease SbcCD ATPase subunit